MSSILSRIHHVRTSTPQRRHGGHADLPSHAASTRALHDEVIQRLFAVNLSLDMVMSALPPDTAGARRLSRVVSELDSVITQVRESLVQDTRSTPGRIADAR